MFCVDRVCSRRRRRRVRRQSDRVNRNEMNVTEFVSRTFLSFVVGVVVVVVAVVCVPCTHIARRHRIPFILSILYNRIVFCSFALLPIHFDVWAHSPFLLISVAAAITIAYFRVTRRR